MEKNQANIEALIGAEKYKEELGIIKKCVEQDKKKGEFIAQYGDVDHREDNLKDKELSQGFQTQCGNKGSKLSGG
jgi:hypothetical protein